METIFIAFNDETDSARANHVRKQLLASERFRVAGYSPYTTWAKCKSGDSLENLRDILREEKTINFILDKAKIKRAGADGPPEKGKDEK